MTDLRIIRSLFVAALLLLAARGFAHEFWIAAEPYQVGSDGTVTAQFKNGENFTGINLGFFDRRSRRMEMLFDGQVTPFTPRSGNIPAIKMSAPGDGLLVLAHETQSSTIKYDNWDKFQAFADHKGFADMRARHLARGLPLEGFREVYTRHAKALIAAGSGAGADRALGLETEFVALINPYVDDLANGVPVQLFYEGKPRAGAQVEVFERAPDGTVAVTLFQTDADGVARLPVRSGHTYLVDAVVLREGPPDQDHVWETLWAAMTFAVP